MNQPLDPVPLNPFVAELVGKCAPDVICDFDERAGVFQYDAGMPRERAECSALIATLKRYPEAILGVTAVRCLLDGVPQFLLTTDLGLVGRCLARLGAVEIAAVPLADVIADKCGGLAALVRVLP